jgi:hypothetical protein
MTTETKNKRGAIKGNQYAKKEKAATTMMQVRITLDKRAKYDALAKERGMTLSKLMIELLESAMIAT